jgi:hypothetical protein
LSILLTATRKKCSEQKQAEIVVLEEALGSFYLWGENFGNGKLDCVLRESEDLSEVILEFLLEIANILSTGELKVVGFAENLITFGRPTTLAHPVCWVR